MAYGIVARLAQGAIDAARARGIRAGLFRPTTLWPYPTDALRELSTRVRGMLVVELSTGQMVEDVRLATAGRCPVDFHGRAGGVLPSADEVLDQIAKLSTKLGGAT